MDNENIKSNLAIFKKYMDLIYYTNDITFKYPKSEKFGLVSETKTALYNGQRCLVYAQKTYNVNKKLEYLNELDCELRLIKTYIRLAYKYKYITIKNYTTWAGNITDICNMLGGWIKWLGRK